MKKTIITVITTLLINACNTTQPDKKAERERDSLQAIINQRDSTLTDYLTAFSDIERLLDSINIREKNIYLKTEKPSDLKTPIILDEINAEIEAINSLIEKNHRKITSLNSKLKSGNNKNKQLEEAIKTLNEQLAKKETELSNLNSKLLDLNVKTFQLQETIGVLQSENAVKDEIIQNEADALHRVYYIVRTLKELEKSNIVDEKGGLLGIGKTSKLHNDFDVTQFTKIDYTKINTIPVNSKKARIVTTHSSNSYKFEKENGVITDLIITNSEEFWKVSKYLVVIKSN